MFIYYVIISDNTNCGYGEPWIFLHFSVWKYATAIKDYSKAFYTFLTQMPISKCQCIYHYAHSLSNRQKQRRNLNNLHIQLVQSGVPNFPFIELLDFTWRQIQLSLLNSKHLS